MIIPENMLFEKRATPSDSVDIANCDIAILPETFMLLSISDNPRPDIL
jgi:hypothetical protein